MTSRECINSAMCNAGSDERKRMVKPVFHLEHVYAEAISHSYKEAFGRFDLTKDANCID